MPHTVEFGCKNCRSPHLREKGNKLFCASCGSVFEKNVETDKERDARILYLSRLDQAEKCLRISPPNFDEAEDLYRDFIKHYPDYSDGYWGLVRARYGIKYETDPSGKEIPSCYKSSYEDFRKDSDFLKALELAESDSIYDSLQEKAKLIAGVCKECREESKIHDYDIFISFKQNDDKTGIITADTAVMEELYKNLRDDGYKVFFAPESTKKIGGRPYEPFIFNALQKSKVMIVFGSKPEYFSATWVQNEWTRFLRMQSRGEKKKGSCIVAYKDFNPNELPHLLRGIQALDASKMSFYKDITNCLNAVLSDKKSKNPINDKVTRAAVEPTVNYSRKSPVVRKTWAEKRLINEKIKAEQKELRRKEKEQKKARRKAEAKTIDKDIIAKFITILACVAMIVCMIASIILLFTPGRTAAIWCIITSVISLFLSIVIGMAREVSWISIIGGIIFGFTLLVSTLQLFTVYGTTDMVVENYILEKCFINQETVEVPDGVNEIASYAFGGRSYQRGEKIKSITLSDDVKYLRSFAFAGCDSLEEVYLGNNIRFIGARAFLNCNKLERIYFDGTEEEWNEILKGEDLGFILGFVDWDAGISNYEIIFLRQEQ